MPVAPASATLVAKAPYIIALIVTHVPVPWNVDAIGPFTVSVFVLKTFCFSFSAATEMVVHQVMAKLSAAIAQPVRVFIRNGVQQ
ncbi:hypothetical protein D3C87_1901580 [compost metagenome]